MQLEIDRIRIPKHRLRALGNVSDIAESMSRVGLLNPVVLTPDDVLIAGLHRLRAAQSLGWKRITVVRVDLDKLDAELAEIDENLIRNELTALERAEHLARRKQIYEARHPETRHGGDRKSSRNKSDLKRPRGFTSDAATKTKRSRSSVEQSVKIGNLPKDVRDAIRGTPVEDSQTDLLKLARMEAVERRRVATRIANGAKSIKDAKREEHREAKSPSKDHCAKAERDWRLVHSECGALRKKHVADESVDCIITDPPYPREFLNCYSDLGRLAADVLNPGGSCIVMCGQSYLPDVLRRLCEHLEYQWAIAYLTPGGQSAQLWDRKVNTFWKPLLWLIKPPRPSSEWYGDVLSSDSNDNDKRFRDWGQSESGMAAIVNRFTMPGATVLDPFVGGGTTGVVAVKLGRIFIGSDSDVDQITRTRIRLESVG